MALATWEEALGSVAAVRGHRGTFGARGRKALSSVLAAAVVAAVLPNSAPAAAQEGSDDARAEALFNAAKQIRDAGQVSDACPMFASSQRLSPGVGVTLYLADCYEQVGRTASAWEQFSLAEKMARERGDAKRAEIAHGRALALQPKLDRLTVKASATPHDGWTVRVDGAPLPPAMWNSALAVDPGDHRVIIDVPGQGPRTLHAHVDASNRMATVFIDDAAPAAAVAVPVAPPPVIDATASAAVAAPPPPVEPATGATTAASTEAAPAAGSGPSVLRLSLAVGLTALGITGTALGAGFMVKRSNLMNSGTVCDTPQNEDDTATAAAIAFSIGGAALVSALVLFFSAPGPMPSAKPQTGWFFAPAPMKGGGGAVLRATF